MHLSPTSKLGYLSFKIEKSHAMCGRASAGKLRVPVPCEDDISLEILNR